MIDPLRLAASRLAIKRRHSWRSADLDDGQLRMTFPGRSVSPLVFSSLLIWLSLVIKTGWSRASR
jgi:hypothetical protein